jgi:DNA-binding MarR family transcriptional regulator
MAARRGGEGSVRREIGQVRGFRSPGQEATIALLRTASVVNRAIGRVVASSGLSLPQYNALRIVRGAGREGIATLAVRERMVEEGTTITRLLDKLEAAGLVRRERGGRDRREVRCVATEKGRRLLDGLDSAVDAADAAAMADLDRREIATLVRLLDRVRAANAARGAPRAAGRRV